LTALHFTLLTKEQAQLKIKYSRLLAIRNKNNHLDPKGATLAQARPAVFSLAAVYRQSGRLNCNLVENHA
jgi:hypothetical protein